MASPTVYGARAKIGLIVPPTNTANEAEWARLAPDGVTFHTTRMPLHADSGSKEGRARLMADIERALGDLTPARVDVVAYGCTAGSMTLPLGELTREMSALAGRPAVATAPAIVAALRRLGARRVAVATPYGETLNGHEAAFLDACGFEVAAIAGLGIGEAGPHEYIRIAETPLAAVRAHVDAVVGAAGAVDAIVVSCTDFPTLPLIEEIEAAHGAPVVTSNQATFWAALRAAGIDDAISGAGALLRTPT